MPIDLPVSCVEDKFRKRITICEELDDFIHDIKS